MDLDMKFAWCPPGIFLMGSDDADAEKPVHRVTLTKGFYMAVYPITQAQYKGVMGYNPSHFLGDDRPVEKVSWDDCQEFCAKLKQLTNKPIRLPTEAEWEYACRAGTTTKYNNNGNDDDALRKVGWFSGNSENQTKPVGRLAHNAWKLYDTHGNVWEWCQDWYDKDAYKSGDAKDPKGASSGTARVIRGGSWSLPAGYCRAAYRHHSAPGGRDNPIGFRVCFSLE